MHTYKHTYIHTYVPAHIHTYLCLCGRMVSVANWYLQANRCHSFEPQQWLETKLVRAKRIESRVPVRLRLFMYSQPRHTNNT